MKTSFGGAIGLIPLGLALSIGSGACLAQQTQGGQQAAPVQPETVEQKRERLRHLDEERQKLLEEIRQAGGQSPDQDKGQTPGAATSVAKVRPTRPVDSTASVLDRIVVTGTRSGEAIGNIPSAVSVVKSEDIQEGRKAIDLQESLKRVPGVRIEDELGGTTRTRIIIRGTGTRANSPAGSGVRGVKVLVDGIPKNNAGGSAQDLINVDLGSAERIEVVKGPSSVLYGNQSGGVVNIITKEGKPAQEVNFSETVGSYGLFRERFEAGGQNNDGQLSYYTSVFRTDQKGYRQQSDVNSTGFTGKLRYYIDDRSDITTVMSFDRSAQQSPGPLTAAQFAQDPRQASPVFLSNHVKATVEEFRLGVIYRREILGEDELEATGYYIPRHLGPFQQIGVRIPQDFTNRGGGVRYLNMSPLGNFGNRFTVGTDFQDTPITTGTFNSVTGAALAETEEHATTYGLYLMDEFNLLSNLVLSAGGRYDSVRFTSENLTLPNAGQVGRIFKRFTPKVGATYRPIPTLSLYTTFSEGFETPIIGELRTLPGGAFGFNQNLNPQISKNYEVGARGEWLGGRGTFEMALYRQYIRDYISPFGTFPNNSFQNVGKVKQTGFELGSEVTLVPRLSLAVSYTYSDFIFDTFNNGVSNFSGNRLPGVPKNSFYTELRYKDPSGWYGGIEYQYVSDFFVTDANSATNPSYSLTNVRFGYNGVFRGYRVSPYLGLYNVFNKSYSAFALINDANQRYFNPLPKFNAFAGVTVGF